MVTEIMNYTVKAGPRGILNHDRSGKNTVAAVQPNSGFMLSSCDYRLHALGLYDLLVITNFILLADVCLYGFLETTNFKTFGRYVCV